MLSTIRRQSLFVILIILTITLISSTVISQRTYLNSVKEQTYTYLASHNNFIRTLISEEGSFTPSQLQEYADTQNIRITIIAPGGKVLFDSDYDESGMESHLYRMEVQEALRNTWGTSERFSNTQRLPVLYTASYTGTDARPVIRVSEPLEQLRSHSSVFFRYMTISSVLLFLFSLALTLVSLNRITKPLEDVKKLAESYAEGNLKAKKIIHGPLELKQLSLILMEMAERLDGTLAELNTSRTTIESMINNVSQGMLLLDSSLSIVIANSPSYQLIGTDLVLEGRAIHRVINNATLMAKLRESLRARHALTFTLEHYDHLWGETARLVGKDQTKTLRITIDPVFADEEHPAVVITISDMSALVKLELMRKEFVANVSHELKTPITSIAGFAQILLDEGENLSEEQKRHLSIITRQSANMLTVIQDLLLLSSLEKDHAVLSRSWVDIDTVIDQSLLNTRYKAESKHIEMSSEKHNDEGLEVFIHPMLITQAVTNLLMNAITYSPEYSRVLLSVNVDESTIVFKVTDNGCGISGEDQERIFERFYRVDAARSRSQGGTGLGLSIVKHIAQAHDGSVRVESEPGRGSTFTITISRTGKDFSSLSRQREEINS